MILSRNIFNTVNKENDFAIHSHVLGRKEERKGGKKAKIGK